MLGVLSGQAPSGEVEMFFGRSAGDLAQGGSVMLIHRQIEGAGAFRPSELALLGRVFDRLKVEARSAKQREALASRIIANYMAGVTDEEELLSTSRQPLGR